MKKMIVHMRVVLTTIAVHIYMGPQLKLLIPRFLSSFWHGRSENGAMSWRSPLQTVWDFYLIHNAIEWYLVYGILLMINRNTGRWVSRRKKKVRKSKEITKTNKTIEDISLEETNCTGVLLGARQHLLYILLYFLN